MKKYAAYFQKRGVKKGDIVSIMLPTCEDFLAAFFGAQLIKAIPVSLYPPTSLNDLGEWTSKTSKMINSVKSKVLVTDLRISGLCNQLIKENNLDLVLVGNVKHTKDTFKVDIEIFNKEQKKYQI